MNWDSEKTENKTFSALNTLRKISLKQCFKFPFSSRSDFIPATTIKSRIERITQTFSFLYQRALLFDFPRRYFEIEINISFSLFRAGENQFSSNSVKLSRERKGGK